MDCCLRTCLGRGIYIECNCSMLQVLVPTASKILPNRPQAQREATAGAAHAPMPASPCTQTRRRQSAVSYLSAANAAAGFVGINIVLTNSFAGQSKAA